MKALIRYLLPAAAAVALSSCSRPPSTAALIPKVTVSHPQMATVTNWDEYPGHIEAVESVEIRPRVSGHIDSIQFQDGAEVKVGDLLFVIDPRPYQASAEQASAERQRAETRLELTRNDYKRAESLHGTKAISDEEFDTRSKAAREAEASLAAAKAAETAAQLNLNYTRVTAPINGRIGRRLVTVGNLVQGGGMVPGTLLATLVSLEPIYCYFDADESALLRYCKIWAMGSEADSKEGSLPCELALVNEEGFPHQGHIDFFDNQVDAKTGTMRMRGRFANRDRTLVPGMFGKVRVLAGLPAATLLVPAVAIGTDQGLKYVLVLSKESAAGSTNISTGDIARLESLAARLKEPSPADGVSQYLKSQLAATTLELLLRYTNGASPQLQSALANDLARIIHAGPLYEARRFAGVKLSEETQELVGKDPQARLLFRLNRLLLEDAYPLELLKSRVVEMRPIKINRQHGSLRAVSAGLTPQDWVVVNGLMMARPGGEVLVVNAPANEAASAPTVQPSVTSGKAGGVKR